MSNNARNFAVACPVRSVCDHHARVFASLNRLQGHYLGTRRGALGITEDLSKRLPLVGLLSYAVAKSFSRYAEAAKVACFPMFDAWVTRNIPAATAVFSSYGYAVEAFRKARSTGAYTLLDGGNSHFAHYWQIISEEHARWNCTAPPFPKAWYERGLKSIELTDWVFSPSSYVSKSFIDKGFPAEKILHLPYPVDFGNFSPSPQNDIPESPLRVVCTGGVSFRKGFPYLLEAMRIIRKERDAVLMLTGDVPPMMKSIFAEYSDIPIDWASYLSHDQLGQRLKSAHVFALLSIEEGLARTALEAMACGLPVVLTPNTGVSDFVVPGQNGEIVPIRDPQAAAEAIIKCYERRIKVSCIADVAIQKKLSFEEFTAKLINHLHIIDSNYM